MKEAPVLAEHGAIGNGRSDDSRGAYVTSTRGSNSADYLSSRLKRDAPEIAKQLERGEFKSVRSAAKAAGIVKDKSQLEIAKSAWKRMNESEREQFLSWINDDSRNCYSIY